MNSNWQKQMCNWSAGIIISLISVSPCYAGTASKGFRELSRPEKCWVMAHPFVAKKAWRITEDVRHVVDSLEKNGILTDGNGGQLDAFRHAYWMASLVQHMSARKAEKLGRAHEKGNYLQWKKGKQEDGTRADSLMCDMDLKNNAKGIALGKQVTMPFGSMGKVSLVGVVMEDLRKGNLVVMKKDESGNFYDCDGKKIDLSGYKGKWSVPKCEVKSDTAVKRG